MKLTDMCCKSYKNVGLGLQTHWPQDEIWKGQGVYKYSSVTDSHGIQYVVLTMGEKIRIAQLLKRLEFINVKVTGDIETYGYDVQKPL